MSRNGLVVDGDGWFVVNARESRRRHEGPLGSHCTFEGKKRFPHFGIIISLIEPGRRLTNSSAAPVPEPQLSRGRHPG